MMHVRPTVQKSQGVVHKIKCYLDPVCGPPDCVLDTTACCDVRN